MSTREIEFFGKHFVIGLESHTLSEREKLQIKTLQPSGIILFRHNLNLSRADCWREQLALLIEQVKACIYKEEFLIAIDHEGGRVHRFPEHLTHFPAAKYYRDSAAAVATAMAKELRALGFNLSFAPSLDVLTNQENSVIGDRAYSTNPEEVFGPADKFAKGLETEGVLSCGKHFPGHGGTFADSHEELPVLSSSLKELESQELVPFKEYISAGHTLLMTAHVLYPELDRKNPATISSSIITNLLRKELGYQGAVISDDLEMKALLDIPPHQRAVKCFLAGVDFLLVGNSASRPPSAIALDMAKGLAEARKRNVITEKLISESRARIDLVFKKLREIQSRLEPCNDSVIGCDEHLELNQKLRSGERQNLT